MRGGESQGRGMTSPRHFLDLWEIEAADLRAILDDAKSRKAARAGWPKGRIDADAPARERVLAMIFQKNSTRTWFSFDAAIRQLGGDSIISTHTDMQLGRGETIEDTARVLSRMVDAVMIRANRHEDVRTLRTRIGERAGDQRPVGRQPPLPDRRRPDDLRGASRIFVGQDPGLGRGWQQRVLQLHPRRAEAGLCAQVRHARRPIAPDRPRRLARARRPCRAASRSPRTRARGESPGADLVIADTWVSMGDTDADERMAALEPFQVDDGLMSLAGPRALFMHCLPAHRGEEVTEGVIDGPQSVVWDEAENRIHAQKSILAWCWGAL